MLFETLAPAATGQPDLSIVFPRGGDLPMEKRVESVSEAGVVVIEGENRLILGLDRVKSIEGGAAGQFANHAALAERLWRARVRLERSDIAGAEPLFIEIAPIMVMRTGPTAAVAHVGLMRCKVDRGAFVGAVQPWLHAVAAGEAVDHASSILRSERLDLLLIDRETGLAPALPPIYLDVPAVRALAKAQWPQADAAVNDTKDVQRALELSAWYKAAICFEATRLVDLPTTPGNMDRGVSLVRDIVLSRAGDSSRRVAARNSLKIRLQDTQMPWIRVWVKVATGRSLLLEQEEEEKLLGIGFLLEVVAADAAVLPELTGVALAEAILGLRAVGEQDASDRLRDELNANFPNHAAAEWLRNTRTDVGAESAKQGSER